MSTKPRKYSKRTGPAKAARLANLELENCRERLEFVEARLYDMRDIFGDVMKEQAAQERFVSCMEEWVRTAEGAENETDKTFS